VTLPNIMKAKKKAARQRIKPGRLGDVQAAHQDAQGQRAAQAQRRHQGADVATLVDKLKNEERKFFDGIPGGARCAGSIDR
jgi:hypothetical protein